MIRALFACLLFAMAACKHPPLQNASLAEVRIPSGLIHETVRSATPNKLHRLLKAGADPDARDPETANTPLMTALLAERHDQFHLLLRAGADLALTDRVGNTALHTAAQVNEPWLVLELLERGAPRSTRNAQGKTFAAYLFMTPEQFSTPYNREGKRKVREWLRNKAASHSLP